MLDVFYCLVRSQSCRVVSTRLLGFVWIFSPALVPATTFDANPQVIDNNLSQALAVATADIDQDGDQDIVAVGASSNSLVWYENAGDGDGSTWSKHLIDSTVKNPSRLVVLNMDNDDELEIVVSAIGVKSKADDYIYLYDPPAGSPATVPWSRSVITDFAGTITQPNGIEVVDIDGDTDLDVVAALFDSDQITWYENPGIASMTSTQWTEHVVESSVLNPRFVIAANIDGDDDIDIVTASFSSVLSTGRITWHETTDDGANWAQHVDLSTKRAVSLAAGDINDDNKIDIIAALRLDDSVAVLSQPASTPETSTWSEVTVSDTVPQTRSVVVADIDNDCDLDIATAAFGTNSSGSGGKILWHDNPQIGSNASWDTYVIDETNLNGATEVALADLDGDGLNGSCLGLNSRDLDVVDSVYTDGTVNWYSNQRLSTIKITDTSNLPLNTPLSVSESNQPPGTNRQQFRVELSSQPLTGSEVTVPIVAPTIPANEIALDKTSLVFNDTDWNIPQTVTVTAVNDAIDDGNQTFNISFGVISSALDPQYDDVAPEDLVAVTTLDDDTAGVTVNPLSGQTSEAGGMTAFSVVLDSEPLDDVTITVSSSDSSEGTVNKSSLTFTSLNWNQAQSVTVNGVDDAVDDGDIAYSIQLDLTSADPKYAAIDPDDVSMINNDDADTAGISIVPVSEVTSENGTKATFKVALSSEPLADIVLAVISQDSTEGIADPASLTFTSLNWSDTQTVTVTGQDDGDKDGNVSYNVRLSVSNANGDIKYATIAPVNVPLNNQDNDQPPSETIFNSGGFEGD